MRRYKVTYRYRKDGRLPVRKTELVYSDSAKTAIENLKSHYIDEANDSVNVKVVALIKEGLEIRYHDSDPDDDADHEVIFDDFQAEKI